MSTKADYVRAQGQSRNHHCHWPGCAKQVPPAMWGCKSHWFALPAGLRARVWSAYLPGQEVNGTPSAAYLQVAHDVQQWISDSANVPPSELPVMPRHPNDPNPGSVDQAKR